jgi:hypothetical protein
MNTRADIPDWPRRMGVELAAAYLGVGESTLREGWPRGRYPAPIRDGKRVLWDRRVLDQWADLTAGLVDPDLKPW